MVFFFILFDLLNLCVHVLVNLMLIVILVKLFSMVYHLLLSLLMHLLHFLNYPIVRCCWIGNHLPSKREGEENKMIHIQYFMNWKRKIRQNSHHNLLFLISVNDEQSLESYRSMQHASKTVARACCWKCSRRGTLVKCLVLQLMYYKLHVERIPFVW